MGRCELKPEMPKMTPEVSEKAEKAYAKLHAAGVVEQRKVEKSTLKRAKQEDAEERHQLTDAMRSLGDDAPHAAKAFQKFRQGKHTKLHDADRDAANDAWEKYKS